MRRPMALAAAAALIGTAALVPLSASAHPAAAAPIAASSSIRPVQYYGAGPHHRDDLWERRRHWREGAGSATKPGSPGLRGARRGASRQNAGSAGRGGAPRASSSATREQQYGYGPAYGHGYQRGW